MTNPAANPSNYCYRHPNRQSFALCQRCTRTICGECQTPAAVGVVCPECMKQQSQNRTSAQRKADRRWSSREAVHYGHTKTPVVTYTIIAITLLTGIAQFLNPEVTSALLFNSFYLVPELGMFEPWRIVTAAFVHGGILHFALNMMVLYMVGRALEPALGTARFLILYLLSAIGGSVAVGLLDFGTSVVGASGAIFGLFGAYILLARRSGADVTGVIVVVGINLVIGFIPGMGISWQAHVGGLVVGLLVALVLHTFRRRQQTILQYTLLAVIFIAEILLLWLSVQIAFYGGF